MGWRGAYSIQGASRGVLGSQGEHGCPFSPLWSCGGGLLKKPTLSQACRCCARGLAQGRARVLLPRMPFVSSTPFSAALITWLSLFPFFPSRFPFDPDYLFSIAQQGM